MRLQLRHSRVRISKVTNSRIRKAMLVTCAVSRARNHITKIHRECFPVNTILCVQNRQGCSVISTSVCVFI